MDLSVIIVNWCSKDFLIECLNSIENQSVGISTEVIIIDNGSYDGCAEIIQKQFPWAIFIQSEKNLGFARANNEAFRKSIGRIILFLNPDTVLGKDTLEILTNHMDMNPDAGALGCRLTNSDGTLQYYCIQEFPNLINEIFSNRIIKMKILSKYHESIYQDTLPVDCISGACLMVRRDVFERVGRFSEDYFMYSEDVDICRKIWENGFKVLYFKGTSIIHHEGKSSFEKEKEISAFSTIMMINSRYIYFKKFNGIIYASIFRILMLLNSLLRFLFLMVILCIAGTSRKKNIRIKILKWKAIILWCAGFRSLNSITNN